MTTPILHRLRNAAAAIRDERVSMRATAQADGAEVHGTVLLLLAIPCLLPVPGVGTVFGLGLVALAVAMWRGHCAPCLPHRVAEIELPRHWAQPVLVGLGLVFRDGVAVILGLLMSGVAVVATTALLLMAWIWGSK
jgi:hypothetical protein